MRQTPLFILTKGWRHEWLVRSGQNSQLLRLVYSDGRQATNLLRCSAEFISLKVLSIIYTCSVCKYCLNEQYKLNVIAGLSLINIILISKLLVRLLWSHSYHNLTAFIEPISGNPCPVRSIHVPADSLSMSNRYIISRMELAIHSVLACRVVLHIREKASMLKESPLGGVFEI